jgi:hypothetical protein
MQQLGATAIVIMNISGSDPIGMLRTYGEHVLPELRGGWWPSVRAWPGRCRPAWPNSWCEPASW